MELNNRTEYFRFNVGDGGSAASFEANLPRGRYLTNVTIKNAATSAPIFVGAWVYGRRGSSVTGNLNLGQSWIKYNGSNGGLGQFQWQGSVPIDDENDGILRVDCYNNTGSDAEIIISFGHQRLPGGGGGLIDPQRTATWVYEATFTQTSASGGTVKVNISPNTGNEIDFLYGRIGADNYAAGRGVSVVIMNSSAAAIAQLFTESIDNVVRYIPEPGEATINTGFAENRYPIQIAGSDYFQVIGGSLAQNETLTLKLRFKVYSELPTVTTTGSGGTVQITNTTNKVI